MAEVINAVLKLISEYAVVAGVPLRILAAGLLAILLIGLVMRWGGQSDLRLQRARDAAIEDTLHGKHRLGFADYVAAIPTGDFLFLGISAKRFVAQPDMAEKLVELSKKNESVRFLLLDPESPNLDRKALEEGDDPATWRQDILATLGRLQKLNEKDGAKIEVRLYQELPIWRLIVLGEQMHVTWFAGGQQGIETPVIVLNKKDAKEESNLYQAFMAHIAELWRHGSRKPAGV